MTEQPRDGVTPPEDTAAEPVLDADASREDMTVNPPEPDVNPAAARSAEYFEDDEEFLEAIDHELVRTETMGIYQQDEQTVSWEILNFLKDNGKPRNRLQLRNDPPILHIASSDGQTADFLLTPDFVKGMTENLDHVEKAFYGIDTTTEKLTIQEKFANLGQWVSDHKGITILLGVVLLLFIIAIVF